MFSFYSRFCAGLYHWFSRIDNLPKFYTWTASSGFLIFVSETLFNVFMLLSGQQIFLGRLETVILLILVFLNGIYQYFTDYGSRQPRMSLMVTKLIFFGSAALFIITMLAVGPTRIKS